MMSTRYSKSERDGFTAQRQLFASGVGPVVFCLLFVVSAAIALLGGQVLSELGIEYVTTSGSAWEKLHPSSYLIVLGFGLWALEAGRQQKALLQVLTGQPAAFLLLSASFLFLIYNAVVVGEQFSVIIESFIAPTLLLYVVRETSDNQKRLLAACIHVLFIINSTIGIYEFVTGAALIPPQLVDYVNTGAEIDMSEWEVSRVCALWSHPLTATLATGAYLLANFVMPASSPFPLLRGIGVSVSLVALPGFGGRFSILLFTLFSAYLGIRWALTFLATNRAPRVGDWIGLAAILIAAAAVAIGNDAGYFDKFIDRLYDDNGSASTRSAAVDILFGTDTLELLFGDINGKLMARMESAGTVYGVEIFWIAFLLHYGLLISLVVFPALLCFIIQTGRDLGFAGVFVSSYFIMSQSGAIGLCAKTTLFSCVVLICYILLPRRQALAQARPATGASFADGGNLSVTSPHAITELALPERDLR
ncbi:MAG: VpsF family polysaccharide biosynthesis protein [Rhodomicrobium sp.]|jgi:hypothetical protein